MNVKGKVVIVTASTRGIGWACVQAFVREGAIVYLAARNEEAAKKENRGAFRRAGPGQMGLLRRVSEGVLRIYGRDCGTGGGTD